MQCEELLQIKPLAINKALGYEFQTLYGKEVLYKPLVPKYTYCIVLTIDNAVTTVLMVCWITISRELVCNYIILYRNIPHDHYVPLVGL